MRNIDCEGQYRYYFKCKSSTVTISINNILPPVLNCWYQLVQFCTSWHQQFKTRGSSSPTKLWYWIWFLYYVYLQNSIYRKPLTPLIHNKASEQRGMPTTICQKYVFWCRWELQQTWDRTGSSYWWEPQNSGIFIRHKPQVSKQNKLFLAWSI
jgi:hypothetical protein